MNKIVITGNIIRDPEGGETQSGITYCRFTVGVNREYKDKDGLYITDFIKCRAWRANADYANKNFKKGNRVAVSGSMQCEEYENRNGDKVRDWFVSVDHSEKLTGFDNGDKPYDEKAAARKEKKAEENAYQLVEVEGELPF